MQTFTLNLQSQMQLKVIKETLVPAYNCFSFWETNGVVKLKDADLKNFLLVQCGHGLSGFDLVQPKRECKATGQFLNAADMRGRSVQVGSLVLDQLIEKLQTGKVSKLKSC